MEVDILNRQEIVEVTPFLEDLLRQSVRVWWELEGSADSPEVSIVLCDRDFIQQLNSEYRGLDEPTDVLSFPQAEFVSQGIPKEIAPDRAESGGALWPLSPVLDGGRIILGDVVISLETALKQAEAYGHSLEREVVYLLIHGLLHLLGLDHETLEDRRVMREKEERILSRLDLRR
ncbi:MAG: rRNA maturation RNase YbeY [Firmicutes bacterium]|nr:rRNA maturation RNase YbeY [Bacillota bacterium]